MAKKAKRVKDLDPKGRAKNVKGGSKPVSEHVGRVVQRTNRNVNRILTNVGQDVERAGLEAGEAIQRAVGPS